MTEASSPSEKAERPIQLLPFIGVSLIWLAVTVGVTWSEVLPEARPVGLVWAVGLWALCLLDLFALMRTLRALIQFMSAPPENRGILLIQTSYWGFIKLACLGIFTLALIKGHSIPRGALLLGVGTLVVVPLVGGYWWSQRALRSGD